MMAIKWLTINELNLSKASPVVDKSVGSETEIILKLRHVQLLPMPELRECIAHFLCVSHFFQYCIEKNCNLSLIGLWADATDSESQLLAPDGLVYRLSASSTVKRGSRSAQTSLWPEMRKKTRAQPNPPAIQSLVWEGVHWTSRAIIMDMGELYFQVCNFCIISSY